MSNRLLSLVKNLGRVSTMSGIETRSMSYMPRLGDTLRPVTLVTGNGKGRLMIETVVQVIEAMDAPVYFETYAFHGDMNHLPYEVVSSIRKNKVCLKGGLMTSMDDGVRKKLDLFASLVKCCNLAGQHNSHKNVDIVVIRENTEGEYAGLEHEVVPGVIESFEVTTKFWTERIAKFAFEYAQMNNRRKVTAVHSKGKDFMKLTDAFFLESCQDVSKMYPSITYDEFRVDHFCLQLVVRPEQFDVMVTPNIYGNIVANIAAGVAGGNGVMPGGNVGLDYAVFEQIGSTGEDENLVALLLTAAMMLRHLQLLSSADRLETAVKRVTAAGRCGKSSTQEFVDAVIANLD